MSRKEYENARKKEFDVRPWGWYKTLEEGPGYKVKKICVYPGEVLSLQYHNHRDEQWIVISGTGHATIGAVTFKITQGSTVSIPQGMVHTVTGPEANSKNTPLFFIEVATSTTHPLLEVDENDIIRIEDKYGRN